MRTIDRTTRFKRVSEKGRLESKLDDLLVEAIDRLRTDSLPRFRDHPPSGTWDDCRDGHIRPDLVLIYRKPDADTLQLVGSARIVNSAFDRLARAPAKLETS